MDNLATPAGTITPFISFGSHILFQNGNYTEWDYYGEVRAEVDLKGESACTVALEITAKQYVNSGNTTVPDGTVLGRIEFFDGDTLVYTHQIRQGDPSGFTSITLPNGDTFTKFEIVQDQAQPNNAQSMRVDNITVSVNAFSIVSDFGPVDNSISKGDIIDLGGIAITRVDDLATPAGTITPFVSVGSHLLFQNGNYPGWDYYGEVRAEVDLKGESARTVALEITAKQYVGDSSTYVPDGTVLGRIEFFDGDTLVYTHQIRQGDPSGFTSITLPNGDTFTKFEIVQDRAQPNNGQSMKVDNIIVGDESTVPEAIASLQEQVDDLSTADQLIEVAEGEELTVEAEGTDAIDTLTLTGADQVLDLTALAEGQVTSMEVIDITGTGNNTLNLSLSDVLAQGGNSLFTGDDSTQMMIKGNAGDVVNLADLLPDGTDPGDWASAGTATVAGVVYNVYQHSSQDAQLLVQDGVTTNLV
ncbi:hypothetical protein ACW9IB_23440 [Pseudomonas sp. SDO524_S393]